MRQYPEWFIGGPWHGRDKLKECPHLQTMIRVASTPSLNVAEILGATEPSFEMPPIDQYIYVPKFVDVFGERLTVWIGEGEGSELRRDRYPDWVLMFGQMLMFPHRNDESRTPADVQPVTRNHALRWEVENEVRRDVEREFRNRVQYLERENVRLASLRAHAPPTPVPVSVLDHTEGPAGYLEFYEEEESHVARFDKITLYFDEGDGDENPPSWVATAQGPPGADDHGKPYTGYGTTQKAAIIALLADRVGVYARMIEIGERMR